MSESLPYRPHDSDNPGRGDDDDDEEEDIDESVSLGSIHPY